MLKNHKQSKDNANPGLGHLVSPRRLGRLT